MLDERGRVGLQPDLSPFVGAVTEDHVRDAVFAGSSDVEINNYVREEQGRASDAAAGMHPECIEQPDESSGSAPRLQFRRGNAAASAAEAVAGEFGKAQKPQPSVVILYVVDDSGSWGVGGFFSALSRWSVFFLLKWHAQAVTFFVSPSYLVSMWLHGW